MTSPTSRTLNYLRERGWKAQVVEKWIPQAKRRVDLFGIIDIIAVRPGGAVLGIQATSTPNMRARILKAQKSEGLSDWLSANETAFWVIGWAKCGPRGKRKTWTPRVTVVDIGSSETIVSLDYLLPDYGMLKEGKR